MLRRVATYALRWWEQAGVWLFRALSYPTILTECVLAGFAILPGVYVLWPGRPTFMAPTAMAGLSDEILGGVLALHGLAWLIVLQYGAPHLRRRGALISSCIWSGLAVGMAWSPPGTVLPVPMAFGLTLGCLWVYVALCFQHHVGVLAFWRSDDD